MEKSAAKGSKRKRALAAEQPTKKRRSSSEEAEAASARILSTERSILESKKNYNEIPGLLRIAEQVENGEPDAMLASVALCRVFIRLLAQGSFVARKSQAEKDAVVVSWLKGQYSQYKRVLMSLLGRGEHAVTALTLSMRLLKAEGEFFTNKDEYSFPTAFLESIVKAVVASNDEDLRRSFIQEFAEQYDDIRFFTFKSIKNLVESLAAGPEADGLFGRAFALISALDGIPESADDLQDFYVAKPRKKSHPLCSVTQHKKHGQEAWLALMRMVDTNDERKRILDKISTVIAPWFTKPEILADFLTSCYDAGGSLSLLALSGVFYLIRERNLDYPSFYAKLYSLLDRDVLHSKHRSRFFRLLDTFLASTHLPAALVASFLKRLSLLSLNAPPSAVAVVVPWIYNMLKRHPACTFMLHRVVRDAEAKQQVKELGFTDPFVPEETDPMKTKAIESCLWELVQLQCHYHPNIATIAKMVSDQFTKQAYNMEDFLDHSYASLLEAELGKDVKKAPVIEFQIPKRIFVPDESAAPANNLLVRLWDFGTHGEVIDVT
ncbi:hypothetical protein UVI_02048990 [Ustilaginoidea virens]|nr:hypothetical protein UVI_02048990 [Ustilaginoidea virens]